jgi:hypothetical protein
MKKKANRERDDVELRAEYDFKLAPRARYASRFKESAADREKTIGEVRSWAPLIDFPWRGAEKQIVADTYDTWVRAGRAYTGYSGPDFKRFLSQEEHEECRGAEHWLQIDQPVHSSLSPRAAINSFLIALWVVTPTRTHVPLRFEVTKVERSVARLLDRFQWIEGQVRDEIHGKHLHDTARLIRPVQEVYTSCRRLRNALVLTFQGCVSRQWQVAFTCFAAAAEAILTHSTDHGLGRRLSENFASLTEVDEAGRKLAQERFSRLYGIRSDIVHGRADGRRDGPLNLKDLADFSDLLRVLWRRVLESSGVRAALEGDDERRKLFFKNGCARGSIE